MAKSIFALLDDLKTETSVPKVEDNDGKVVRKNMGMVAHTLPRKGLPTSKQFENADELLAWAKDAGVLHECLQSGIQARIIDYRAIFKGMKKGNVWSPAFGQKNVDKAKWAVTKRPNMNDKEAIKRQAIFAASLSMAKALAATEAVSEKMLFNTLTASCGADLAKEIIASLPEKES